MATAPTSTAGSMIFTQSEATAAQRTWVFHMTLAASGADATGVTLTMTISKAGGAFGAVDAGTAITELTNGWYKVVHAAADLDTIGCLGVRVTGTGADPLAVTHQVTALDFNAATVALATDGISAAVVAADAVTEIQTGLATASGVAALSSPLRNVTTVLGTLSTNTSTTGVSMKNATKAIVTLAGTWGGATVTVQYSPNPQATVPQWLTVSGGAQTSDSTVTVNGPVNAIRCTMSSAGTSSVVCTAEVSYPTRG